MSLASIEQNESGRETIPFVGRQAEIEQLQSCRARMLRGQSAAALISGEAGAGKTRLVEEFGQQLTREGSLFLRGRALELQGFDPYQPVVEIFDALLGGKPDPSSAERQECLNAFLASHGVDPTIFSSFLSALLLLEAPANPCVLEGLEMRRHVLFEGLAHLLQAVAEKQPVCVFLDDMQWASGVIFELLDYLLERLGTARVLLLLAYRDEEITQDREDRTHPLRMREKAWVEKRGALLLKLGRLAEKEVGQLVEGLHLGRHFPAGDLYQRTDGLALFVAEYLKEYLRDGKGLEDGLPPRVQQIIAHRLDQLSADDRATLRCAALLGERFEGELLAATLGEQEAHVLHRLERLRDVYQLLDAGRGLSYRFTHARIRETLVGELSPPLRRAYCLAAGKALEASGESAGRALPDLAYFFRGGNDPERAARYTARAARHFLERQAHEEAYQHAGEALELLEESGTEAKELREEVYAAIAEVMHAEARNSNSVEACDRAVVCCEKGLEVCDDPLRRADWHCRLADLHVQQPAARAEQLQAAEREIGEQRNAVQMARVHFRRSQVDNIRYRLPLLQKARELFERFAPNDPELFEVYRLIVGDLARLEDGSGIEEVVHGFQEWTRSCRDVVLVLRQYDVMASVYRNLGDSRREAEAREPLLDLARQIRHLPLQAGQHTELAAAYGILGDFGRVTEHYARGSEIARQRNGCLSHELLLILAYFAWLAGRTEQALDFVRVSLQHLDHLTIHPDRDIFDQCYLVYLGIVERIFRAAGRPEDFVDYGRRIRQKAASAGAPAQRVWRPQPAVPAVERWRPVMDIDFPRGPAWRWEDPHGVCRYQVAAGRLTLCVTEIVGFNELTFPRLVREVEGDFAVEVEIAGAEEMEAAQRERLEQMRAGRLDRHLPFPGAAGLVARDRTGAAVRLTAHVECPGDLLFDGRSQGERFFFGRALFESGPIVLRLERAGDRFRAFGRTAASGWLDLGETEMQLERRVGVGPCAEIPFPFSNLVRRAEAVFPVLHMYRPFTDLSHRFQQELPMLRELADVASDAAGKDLERELLQALSRSVDAEWGQVWEPVNSGKWKAGVHWGGEGDGCELVGRFEEADGESRTIDAEGKVALLRAGNGRRGVWLFGRSRAFEMEELESLHHAMRLARTLLKGKRLEEELRARRVRPLPVGERNGLFPGIIGRSSAMETVFRQVERIARSAAPVLIQGESGTGKEVIARAIHENGPRAGKVFVAQNCAALPESLLESELFGYRRGAFTGAHADRPGLFEAADGGAIFLDEIGDATLAVQAKLLRAVEEGEVRRVGDTQGRKVDVRILSATSRDMDQAVKEGRLRRDLYYRLNVVRLVLPPLRERSEDIPLLAEHFLSKICARDSRSIPGFTQGAIDLLCAYPWPGNVRELQNEVEQCVARMGADAPLEAERLSSEVRGVGEVAKQAVATGGPLQQMVAHLERIAIREALERCGGNISQVARELGLSRPGLRQKMERYGLRE